jgi:hypothetical protein
MRDGQTIHEFTNVLMQGDGNIFMIMTASIVSNEFVENSRWWSIVTLLQGQENLVAFNKTDLPLLTHWNHKTQRFFDLINTL